MTVGAPDEPAFDPLKRTRAAVGTDSLSRVEIEGKLVRRIVCANHLGFVRFRLFALEFVTSDDSRFEPPLNASCGE